MRSGEKIAGLIVAGGYSSRMGVFKPLLQLGEKTVIETAVDSLRRAGIKDIRVVTGYNAAALSPVLERLGVQIIENNAYADGMFSSVRAGVASLAGEVEAFFLLPGDTPLIRRHSVKDILQVYRKTGAAVVYPVFAAERGHPPLISAQCFARILAHDGTGGLRNVLTQFDATAREVDVADQGILLDMDTLEDYQKLVEYHRRRQIPTPAECEAMLKKYQTDGGVARHGRAVAAVGCSLAESLNQTGLQLDLELVAAGALVHDVAKGKRNHSKRGGKLAACWGFSALSAIIAAHMDMEFSADGVIDETAIVFLADKLVQDDRRVTFLERFRPALDRFSGNQEVLASIRRKIETAEAIGAKTLQRLGMQSFDELQV